MAQYLDPKADLTFKLVFGEHPDLVISLLNALLPLKEGEEIEEIAYLPTEITDRTKQVPQELLESPEVGKAVKILEKSAYTDAQLAGYEQFWDAVSVEKTLMISSERKGRVEGRAEREQEIARELKSMGLSTTQIMQATKLTAEEIEQL